jgi:hypothetical protein
MKLSSIASSPPPQNPNIIKYLSKMWIQGFNQNTQIKILNFLLLVLVTILVIISVSLLILPDSILPIAVF